MTHLSRLGLCLMSALHTELITDYRRSVIFLNLCLTSWKVSAVWCKKMLMETEKFSWNLIKRYVRIPQNAIIPIILFISNHICLVFSLSLKKGQDQGHFQEQLFVQYNLYIFVNNSSTWYYHPVQELLELTLELNCV